MYYKRHTGKASVTYDEALDEALCFGWIDGIVKRIDGERYMQRWTPRKDPKGWSERNLDHMRRLMAEGRMTPAGMKVLGVPLGRPRREFRAEAQRRRGGRKELGAAGVQALRRGSGQALRLRSGQVRAEAQRRRGGRKELGADGVRVPEFIRRAIAGDDRAAAFFARLAPSHRRRYVAWILDAKREETRARRLAEAVRLLAKGLRELLK
ncbi:MAG: YdeI/OmpD-associated family protein [Acidobacteria bacterium]|nr:YdeI/OmpD-associated family protein [Acidobacteriota bacterium]